MRVPTRSGCSRARDRDPCRGDSRGGGSKTHLEDIARIGGRPSRDRNARTPDGTMVDLGTLGGEHSSAAAVSEEEGGTLWVAGHSHDASARLCAVLWAVRLRS